MLDGKQYLVVPVVAIREGVLNGVYVTSAEIEKSLPSWNGRPIPLSHPMQNGQPISANSPRVVERDVIGNLYNVNFANGALRGEMWLDVAKARRTQDGANTIKRLQNNEMVEVSTGYWSDIDQGNGSYKGKGYSRRARNLLPDHLAILINEVGACSIKDGCGAPMINARGELMNNGLMEKLHEGLSAYLGDTPDGERLSALASVLGMDADELAELAKADMAMTDGEELEMMADKPVPMPEAQAGPMMTPPEQPAAAMPEQQDTGMMGKVGAVLEKLLAYIGGASPMQANEQIESEREPSEIGENMNTNAQTPCDQVQVNTDTGQTDAIKQLTEQVSALAGQVQSLVANQQLQVNQEKARLIETLTANATAFTSEELNGFTVDQLRKIESMARPRDYSGRGLGHVNRESGQLVEVPMGAVSA